MNTLTEKIASHVTAKVSMSDCTHCFAVPGGNSMIDLVHPVTGKTLIYGKTLEEVRSEKGYAKAELMTVDDFCKSKAQRQDTPILWEATTEEHYDEMLNCLPPAMWIKGWFLVGEPYDHHAATGQPRFAAFRAIHGRYEHANRPLTKTELRKEMEST